MPNKHITHSDDSHFDISIKPNNRFDGEHTLTFHNDNGMSTALRLDDDELDQLAEVVQNYKNQRDGISYTFTLDARDVDINIEERVDEGLYTEEEERVLRKFLIFKRDDAERYSIISDALRHSIDVVHGVDFHEAVNGIINTTTNIIIANLLAKKY